MTRILLSCPDLTVAARLSREASARSGLTVVGRAADLSTTYIMAEREEPDVVLVTRDLARHPDFEGLESLFRVVGIVWLEVPPSTPGGNETEDMWRRLQTLRRNSPAPVMRATPAAPAEAARFRPERIILIGASTGGIDALLNILGSFPADCPPTAIVQHTGAAFSDSLIRLFARCSAARIVPAQSGLPLTAGTIVIGAGCKGHLRLTPGATPRTELTEGPPISGHVPSVDALFASAAPMGGNVAAALLTGMGRDGAQGLLALRQAGARTIAQDAATSVVYGMPRAAVELGAAGAVLPLGRIAAELLSHCTDRGLEVEKR